MLKRSLLRATHDEHTNNNELMFTLMLTFFLFHCNQSLSYCKRNTCKYLDKTKQKGMYLLKDMKHGDLLAILYK